MDHPKLNRRKKLNRRLLIIGLIFFIGVLGIVAYFETKGKRYSLITSSELVEYEESDFDSDYDYESSEEEFEDETVYVHEEIPIYQEPFLIPQLETKNLPHFDLHILPTSQLLPPSDKSQLPKIRPVCLTPMEALKTGKISKVYNLIAVEQVGLNEIDPNNGYTLMHYLARTHDFSSLERLIVADTYRDIGGINAQDHEGNTPLHLALRYPVICMASVLAHYLIIYDADPEIPNKAGETPRQIARERGNRLEEALRKDYRFMNGFGPVEILQLMFNNQQPRDPIYPYGMNEGDEEMR